MSEQVEIFIVFGASGWTAVGKTVSEAMEDASNDGEDICDEAHRITRLVVEVARPAKEFETVEIAAS